MKTINHNIFDSRARKPRIISDKETNEDYTLVMIEEIKYGKAKISYEAPNLPSIF